MQLSVTIKKLSWVIHIVVYILVLIFLTVHEAIICVQLLSDVTSSTYAYTPTTERGRGMFTTDTF